jgi:hypothetical protein
LALNAQTCQIELSLADAMHQIDVGDRDRRISNPLTPHPAMRCFTRRWSCSIRYFDERRAIEEGGSFVRAMLFG